MNSALSRWGFAAIAVAMAAMAAVAPAAQARVGLASAQKAANAKITSLTSYRELTKQSAGPLRSGGCKRSHGGTVRCSSYRTAYRPCASRTGQQPNCDPLTRIWKTTVAARATGKLKVIRVRTSDRHGYAGPCPGGPCVNGQQTSGGDSVEGAARAAVLAHPSFTNIDPPDPSGSRLITQSCSGIGGGQSECLLYREVADPCHLNGPPSPGSLCIQVLVYRSWIARVTQDQLDPKLFTATVLRHWDAEQPPAK